MNIFKQIMPILILCLIGDLISTILPIPFPGSVIAMLLMFVCLAIGIIKPKNIDKVSDFLLRNMSLVFVPSTVSILGYIDVFKEILWPFLLVCTVTTLVTFFCTAYSVKLTIYVMKKLKGGNKNA